MVRPLTVLLAFKAINFASGLVESDRRVAAALLEHFNRRTGQCDPSLERLAKLLGMSSRTVIRSTRRLERIGLFLKNRHGGHLNRNSYEPVWAKFQEIEVAWRARFGRDARARRSHVSPSAGLSCHVTSDTGVIQTCGSNQSEKTCSKELPSQGSERDLKQRRRPRGTGSAEVARVSAERRWFADLHARFASHPVTYAEIIEAIDADLQERATDAELRKPGAGLAYIVNTLGVFTGVANA